MQRPNVTCADNFQAPLFFDDRQSGDGGLVRFDRRDDDAPIALRHNACARSIAIKMMRPRLTADRGSALTGRIATSPWGEGQWRR